MTLALLFWLSFCCNHFGVEEPFARAVIILESRENPRLETKKVAGLFGLDKAYCREHFGLTREEVRDPYINIYYGVRALRGTWTDVAKVRRMKAYNPEWKKNRYLSDLMACYRKNKRDAQ